MVGSHIFVAISFAFFLLCSVLFVAVESHTTACNHGNDTTCLYGNSTYEGVQGLMQNSIRWWFSKDTYEQACPAHKRGRLECQNPAPSFYSIITRMRMANNNDTSMVTQFLNVHYGVKAGSYKACGSVDSVSDWNRTIDPVHTIKINSWGMRSRPQITWNAVANEVYTLIFWDAGLFRLNGMWVNIRSGNVENGDVVVPYKVPINPFPRKNPFVLALYKQAGDIDVNAAFNKVSELLDRDGKVMLNELVSNFSLTGPNGISMIRMRGDMYSVGHCRDARRVNFCPYLQTSAMKNMQDRLPWNTTGVDLSVSVDVTFNSPPMELQTSCQMVQMQHMATHVDPWAPTQVQSVFTQVQPMVSFQQTYIKDEPFFFVHRSFTLLFLDLCMTSMNVTNKAIVHWQVINIKRADVGTGTTTLSYMAPRVPLGDSAKRYAFLLLEQMGDLTAAQVQAFRGSNCMPEHRCNFDVSKFMTDLNLKLVGMSSLNVATDLYSWRETGNNQATTCPTATNAGVAYLPSLIISVLSLIASLGFWF